MHTPLDRTQPPSFQEIREIYVTRAQTQTLPNGIKLHWLNAGEQPALRLEFIFAAGNWHEPRKGVSYFTAKMLNEGTSTRTAAQINEYVDQFGAFLELNHGVERINVTLYGLNKHLPALLPLVVDLITDSVYSNYRLQFQYRFAGKPGNCGVLVHASTPRALYKMFPKSVEVQMMHQNAGDFWCIREDIAVPDMEKRRGDKAQWGTTEDKLRRIVNLTDNSEKPLGQWNTMTVECLGDKVKVWLNGDLVNYGYGSTARKGQIALQAEGAEVEFKQILLTPITKLTK